MSKFTQVFKKSTKYSSENNYLKFTILILILWFLITVFFYFEHHRVEKEIYLNQEVKIGNLVVKLHELNLINYKSDYNFTESPWYYRFLGKLPQSLIWPAFKIFSFYSFSPLEFNNEEGTIYLRGYIVSPTEKLTYDSIYEKFDVYVAGPYEVGYGGGTRSSHSDNENIVYFEKEGENVPLDVKELYIIVRDKLKKTETKFKISPQWVDKSYSFFNQKPLYPSEPKDSMRSFANLIKQGNKSEATEYIHPDRTKIFPWVNLQHSHWEKSIKSYTKFIGSYQGYENVFAYHMVFGETKYNEFIGLYEQDLYLIDNGQKWIIIDVSPLTKYSLQGTTS